MGCSLLAGAFVAIRLLRGAQSTLTLTWWYHLVSAGHTRVVQTDVSCANMPQCAYLYMFAKVGMGV